MLKIGLKNFCKNLLYVFVPMGIIYLFLIIFTYSFLGTCVSELGKMFTDIFDLLDHSIEQSGSEIQSFIDYAINQINWNANFIEVIKEIFNTNWIANTITGFLQTLDISVEGFTSSFNIIIENFTDKIMTSLAVSLTMSIIGIMLADYVTAFLIRRKTAKRSFKQFIFNWLLSPIFSAVTMVALLWISTIIQGYTFILVFALIIVYEIFALTFSWIIYKDKNMHLKEVVNIKNILLGILTAVIIIAIDIIVFLIFSLINLFIAMLLILPIFIYSLKIISFNADSYVKSICTNNLNTESTLA